MSKYLPTIKTHRWLLQFRPNGFFFQFNFESKFLSKRNCTAIWLREKKPLRKMVDVRIKELHCAMTGFSKETRKKATILFFDFPPQQNLFKSRTHLVWFGCVEWCALFHSYESPSFRIAKLQIITHFHRFSIYGSICVCVCVFHFLLLYHFLCPFLFGL